ncbi:hypothetical protein [Burkholderia lata]|uniref:hypothetical protein n=1 Tax=Burkholderia lata (strain ATCC 17760 / DSM 23089 / LMG 22485 / NCIMB 9086 / R18194 / 383) TaxID=482957 RepID=UPI00158420EC|nr:hypothetical protein [Burkholderia lata]
MPIENIVAAAELSATTDPVGNCMGASPRAACATPDHYPGTEGKSTTTADGGGWVTSAGVRADHRVDRPESGPVAPAARESGSGIDDCGDAA